MPAFYPIQQNFAGGSISPRLQGIVDDPRYKASLNTCENFELTPQGNIQKRNGFQYIARANSANSRLFNFPRTGESDYLVEIDDQLIKLWTVNGQVTQGGQNLLTDPTFENGTQAYTTLIDPTTGQAGRAGEIVTIAGSGVRMQNTINANLANPSTVRIEQVFTLGAANTQYTLRARQTFLQYQDITPNDQYGGAISISILRASDGAVLAQDRQTYGDVAPGTPANSYPSFGTIRNITFNYTPTVANLEVIFRIEQAGGTPFGQYSNILWENLQFVEAVGTPMPVTFPSPYTVQQVRELQVATDTASRIIVFAHPNVRPHAMQEVLNILSFAAINFTAMPATWTGENWPSVVEFFQGRMILASTPSDPGTIWGSEVGTILNFDQTITSPTQSDPYTFELLTNGQIQWIRGSKVLLIGTDRDEWTGSGSRGIIATDDFQFQRQSQLGSTRIRPEFASDQIAYVSTDSRRVRVINFDGISTETYNSQEISIPGEHLLTSGVRRVAYVRDPYYQLVCLTNDNNLQICMQDRVERLTGWYRFTTDGNFVDITATQEPGGDAMWCVVERAGLYNLEIYRPDSLTEHFLDAYIDTSIGVQAAPSLGDFNTAFSDAFDKTNAVDGDKPTIFLNLPTIYGERTISCYVVKPDGRILQHRDLILATGRDPLLDPEIAALGDRVIVGIPYTATAQTLPIDVPSQSGTSQGRLRRYSRIFARLVNDSGIPQLNNRRGRVRNAAPAPEFTTLTGDIEVRDLGQRKSGQVTIVQELPVKTEVIALFGKLSVQVT